MPISAADKTATVSAEEISFRPHFDTLTRSGQWEYYKSEGVDVIPCAFADLIDNSLQATSAKHDRQIVVEVHLSSASPFIYIADNGRGMSKKELADYPVYRLGKERKQARDQGSSENRAPQGILSPLSSQEPTHPPRYLTSEIGYFGVGGKQAAFRLGKVITLMTKSANERSGVGCLTLSEDEFERLDAAGEDPYKAVVNWRQAGALSDNIANFKSFVETEVNYDSFTRIFISQLQSETVTYLAENFESLCRTLAGIYHYYLHGPDGRRKPSAGVSDKVVPPIKATPVRGKHSNRPAGGGKGRGVQVNNNSSSSSGSIASGNSAPDYDLQMVFRLFQESNLQMELNLADIDSDFQSRCQSTQADRFHFVVEIPEQAEKSHTSTGYNGGRTVVEGFVRYHPFLLTGETLPFREELLKQMQQNHPEKESSTTSINASDAANDPSSLSTPACTPVPTSTPVVPSSRAHHHQGGVPSTAHRASYLSPAVGNSLCLSSPAPAFTVPSSTQEGAADQQPIDPALSNQAALLSQKPEFDLFWNGRLVPNSRIPFSIWKWTDKGRRTQLAQEVFHRLTGCLFFDGSFGVTQNKLTFIDTSVLSSDTAVVVRPVVDGKVKSTPVDVEFFNWLKECNLKFDKFGVFYKREKGFVSRPELKGNAKKQWAVFKGVRMGDLDLKEGSFIKFRATRGAILYGVVRRFFVCADNIPDDAIEAIGFGGDVEAELQPDWIRSACASYHPPPPGFVVAPVGNIDFKIPYAQVVSELEALQRKFPAAVTVIYKQSSSSSSSSTSYSNNDDDNVNGRFREGVPACRVLVVDSAGNDVHGRLVGSLCTIGHKMLPVDTMQLRIVMRVTKATEKTTKVGRAAATVETVWEERHRVESAYSDKEGAFLFNEFPLSDPGSYRLSFTVISNLPEVTDRLSSKVTSVIPFRIRPSLASVFSVELEKTDVRLGQPIKFRLNFRDANGVPARPPVKSMVHICVVGDAHLQAEPESIPAVISVESDQTFIPLEVSQIVGQLNLQDTSDVCLSKKVELAFSLPEFNSEVVRHSLNLSAGVVASAEITPSTSIDVENHSQAKFCVELKDHWGNPTYQSDVRITVTAPGQQKGKTFTVKSNCYTALLPTPIINGTPYSAISCKVEITAPHSDRSIVHYLTINVLPSKRPAGLRLSLLEIVGGTEHVLSSSTTGQNISIAAGKALSAKFSILDEAGGILPIAEMPDEVLNTFQVSWYPSVAGTPKLDDLRAQRLPNLAAPLTIKEPIPHFISFRDNVNTIRCDFNIGVLPLDPVGLAFLGLPSSLPVGAALPNTIQLALVDVHGNTVAFKPGDVGKIMTDPPAKLTFQKQSGVIALSQFTLGKCTVAGEKIGLEARFGTFAPAQASISLVPGQPAKLLCVRPSPATLNLVAGHKISDFSFEFNLVDDYSNICPVEIQRVSLTCSTPSSEIHFTPELRQRKMKDGVVTFGPYSIVASKAGPFSLTASVAIADTATMLTEKVAVVVAPNPDEAVHIQLGQSFPLVGKAAQTIGTVNVHILNHARAHLSTPLPNVAIGNTRLVFVPHKLIPPVTSSSSSSSSSSPPLVPASEITRETFEFRATEQTSPGVFAVHNVTLPTVAGEWMLKFSSQQMRSSEQILISISPTEPAQLLLIPARDCLHLSNGKSADARTLIGPASRLEIADRYGNVCVGANANLTVELRIIAPPPPSSSDNTATSSTMVLPRLEGAQASGRKVVRLDPAGKVAAVLLAENTPCVEGVQYLLEVKATAQNDVKPLRQNFSITNDFERAQQCRALEGERQTIREEINKLNASIKDLEHGMSSMDMQRHEKHEELVAATKNAVDQLNNRQIEQMTDDQLEGYLRNLQDNIDQHLSRPRRLCRCRPFDAEEQVLGKIAQLALVENDDVARVVSWHIAGRMDAVVTLTVEKLQDIFRRFNGQQQVVAISLMPNQTRPWDDVLPHMKLNRRSNSAGNDMQPEGNPVYARHCLQITAGETEAAIRKLFQAILGDTVIVDTIEDAFAYRKMLIDRGGQAPSILTRHEGNRVDTLGFAGGGGNRAPPLSNLNYVFGAPPPTAISQLRGCIEAVERLKLAKTANSQLETEHRRRREEWFATLSDLRSKRKTLNERLQIVERDLNQAPPQPHLTTVVTVPSQQAAGAPGTLSRKRTLPDEAQAAQAALSSPSRRPR